MEKMSKAQQWASCDCIWVKEQTPVTASLLFSSQVSLVSGCFLEDPRPSVMLLDFVLLHEGLLFRTSEVSSAMSPLDRRVLFFSPDLSPSWPTEDL